MKLFKKYVVLPVIALLLFVGKGNAQVEFPEDKVSWKFSLEQNGCEATIVVKVTCVEHWHVYAANLPESSFLLATEVEPDKSSNYEVIGKVIEPKPEFYHDEAADEDIYQHSKSFTLKRKIKITNAEDFTLKGRFSFQTCDESHCLPPYDTDFSLKVKGCGADEKKGAVFDQVAGGAADASGFEFPEDKVSWKFSVEQDGTEATIIADITCIEGWHINAANIPTDDFGQGTTIDLEESSNYSVLGKVEEPEPHFYHDDAADEDVFQHSGTFRLTRKITVASKEDFTLKGKFGFITCDDSHCLTPYETDFEVEVKGSADAVAAEGEVASDEKEEKLSDMSIWTIFFLSFGAGFAALLTPCVFPMIPMTVSFFTKQSKSKAQGIRNATFYGICIIGIYVILGTLVTWLFGASILNWLSTQWWFNMAFFILLVVFAVSFMGAFEITLPSSWVNKADKASDKGGLVGIFFMALVLALVSFSCTGPIVGTLLVEAADIGGIAPVIGMLGFSTALALPFALFAAFPGWLNTMPKSGGWLTSVKVFLGFLELALAFKFLSNADLAVQAHLLEREMFLAIWIAVFGVLAMYLFGFIQLPHDGPVGNLSVGRALLGTSVVVFVVYMIPGLWGAPLKLINAFPPPMHYSESPLGVGKSGSGGGSGVAEHGPEGTHMGAQNLWLFHDLDKAQAYAKKVGKPLFIDFTGHNCVNCRKMEQSVWGETGVIEKLRDDVVIVSLYVDEDIDLPIEEQIDVELAPGKMKKLKTVGDKWAYTQIKRYKITAQPYYRMLGPNGEDLTNGAASYKDHSNPKDFEAWVSEGIKLYKEAK
ncbi:MAG: protein-disulfide reductase DsbD family protein [Vicingaceae bacterium]|nr:protein-disulfide reductase DsbD family protein [Vicingaceae bacterium]